MSKWYQILRGSRKSKNKQILKVTALYLMWNQKISKDPPSCGQDDLVLWTKISCSFEGYLIMPYLLISQKLFWTGSKAYFHYSILPFEPGPNWKSTLHLYKDNAFKLLEDLVRICGLLRICGLYFIVPKFKNISVKKLTQLWPTFSILVQYMYMVRAGHQDIWL